MSSVRGWRERVEEGMTRSKMVGSYRNRSKMDFLYRTGSGEVEGRGRSGVSMQAAAAWACRQATRAASNSSMRVWTQAWCGEACVWRVGNEGRGWREVLARLTAAVDMGM